MGQGNLITSWRRGGTILCLLVLLLATFGFATVARADETPQIAPGDDALEVEPLDQVVLDDAGYDVGDASEMVGSAAEAAGDASTMAVAAQELNTFKFRGTKDYALAKQLVDAARAQNKGLKADQGLTEAAMQRAAEIAVYFEDSTTGGVHVQRRPDGSDFSTAYTQSHPNKEAVGEEGGLVELIYLGANANGTTAYNALKGIAGQDSQAALTNTKYKSIGVGCFYQGTGHFFVVLLGTGSGTGQVPTSRQANQLVSVSVDMGGSMPALRTRVRTDVEDPLIRKKGSWRDMRFYWVTAQNVRTSYPTMPALLIDPSTFTWTSTNNSVANVNGAGRVTIRTESTPSATRTATIRAQVAKGNRYLTLTAVAAVPVYRLYNPNSGEHFYTENTSERDYLHRIGWHFEGLAWYDTPKGYGTPVYRVYNPNAGDHHYTTSEAERNNVVHAGWRNEGIGWYTTDIDGALIYRAYNPNAVAGAHHWTTNKAEYDHIVKLGWRAEGIGFYSVP